MYQPQACLRGASAQARRARSNRTSKRTCVCVGMIVSQTQDSRWKEVMS
jgi:hypothetical protein